MANPNPSPSTRFKPGQTPNPGGKSSEQKRIELENARLAMEARNKFLMALTSALDAPDVDILELMDAQALKLLKDSEDRGLGAPVQDVNMKMSLGNALDELPDD